MLNKDSVEIAYGYNEVLKRDITKRDVIVFIDALRASNTVLTLLNSGVSYIRLFSDLREIIRFKKMHNGFIFVGEQGGRDIAGFDYNNSPTKIFNSNELLRGKKIAMITSNFAAASHGLRRIRCTKLVASLLNAGALRCFLSSEKASYDKIFLLAVGRNKKRTVEDDKTADFLKRSLIQGRMPNPDRINDIYYRSESARGLKKLGYSQDIDFCVRYNLIDIVPEIKGTRIIKRYTR